FDNSGSSLTSTDVESALKELESLIGSTNNETTTTLTPNGDGTYTYVNESGASVVLDANTIKVVESSGVYTFVDAAGATVAVIDFPAAALPICFDNSGSSLTSTDVESALKELESLIGSTNNETTTTLTPNGDGTYTYVNES